MSASFAPNPKIDHEIIAKIAATLEDSLRVHSAATSAPNERKELDLTYPVSAVEEMTGLKRHNLLRRPLENPDFPTGRVEGSRRLYSLHDVHKIMEIEGIRPSRGNGQPLILTVANYKGGVSKTSTAINIAQDFCQRGYRVLAVDLDPQGSLTTCFGLNPAQDVDEDESILPFLEGGQSDLNYAVKKTYWDGLDILPACLAIAMAEQLLPTRQMRENTEQTGWKFYESLRTGLDTVKYNYDLIVIDTPPNLGHVQFCAIFAADAIIMPCPPIMLDVQSTSLFVIQLAQFVEQFNAASGMNKEYAFLKVLITGYLDRHSDQQASVTTAEAMATWIRYNFGALCVLNSTMPTTQAIRDAAAINKTLYEVRAGEINRETLNRALNASKTICNEIESLAKAYWGVE